MCVGVACGGGACVLVQVCGVWFGVVLRFGVVCGVWCGVVKKKCKKTQYFNPSVDSVYI